MTFKSTSRSTDQNSAAAKNLIFDASFFFYSLLLLGGLVAYAGESANFWLADQEFFQHWLQTRSGLLLIPALVALGLAWLVQVFKLETVGRLLFTLGSEKQRMEDRPFFRSFWKVHLAAVFSLTLILSVVVTEASLTELLDRDGIGGAVRLWSGLANPNFGLLAKAVTEAVETIFIAFLATVIAIPIAFVAAFFCAKNLMKGPLALSVYSGLRLLLNITRSVEPLIWALIFTVWVGVGPFAGMLALMLHSVASLTKYYSEIIEGVNEGPVEGVRSTGASEIQTVWYAVLPQIVLPYLGMTIYRWDTNVRMATVIGLVGGGGIGTLLIQYQGQAMWPEVGCIILVIAFIVWLMDTASAYIREALK